MDIFFSGFNRFVELPSSLFYALPSLQIKWEDMGNRVLPMTKKKGLRDSFGAKWQEILTINFNVYTEAGKHSGQVSMSMQG
ncbi:MAG: hypothetical protein ACI4LO_02025 [Anaerovoracaceae bacterium]